MGKIETLQPSERGCNLLFTVEPSNGNGKANGNGKESKSHTPRITVEQLHENYISEQEQIAKDLSSRNETYKELQIRIQELEHELKELVRQEFLEKADGFRDMTAKELLDDDILDNS